MDQFQVFLAARNIEPGVTDWSQERDFVTNRLKTEIFNQAFGVEKAMKWKPSATRHSAGARRVGS